MYPFYRTKVKGVFLFADFTVNQEIRLIIKKNTNSKQNKIFTATRCELKKSPIFLLLIFLYTRKNTKASGIIKPRLYKNKSDNPLSGVLRTI